MAGEGERARDESSESPTPSDRLNNSRILGGIIALTGVVFAVYTFATQGLNALNLNTVNFAFLFIGFALFTSPLLAITDMRARGIFGYAIMMLLLLLPVVLIAVVVPYANFWSNIIPF